ncbi:voltage gated chloride channel domain-containing protein [Ditylenchus destructor]|nr:voltage gated chloride channel domain-containing protein [Ditylenchus destructor]
MRRTHIAPSSYDRKPLLRDSRGRVISHNSLDPNEDPVIGLERVSSLTNLQNAQRRWERERRRRLMREADESQTAMNRLDGDTISEKFESLDYEIVENELYRAAETDKEHQQNLFRQSVDRWVVCFLIGVCTAVVASIIDILVYYSSQLKFHIIITTLVNVCEHRKEADAACYCFVLLFWALYNCLLVGIASILVLCVSPVAAGSGIPQIKCFLNGVQIPGVVRLRTLFAKALGVACSVGGGLAAGKEGPMIHSGAIVAAGISQGRCITFPFDLHIFQYFRNDREKRDFISAGAAAGVSAAFAAPIGGVLFSLEEGASFWNQSLTWRMVFTAMISTFTLNCFLSIFYGRAGYLSWDGLANFGVFDNKASYALWELPFFMIIGILGGLLGALFNALNMKLSVFRRNYVKTKRQKFLECLLVAAASAFTGYLTLIFVDDCKSIGIDPEHTDAKKLWCPKGKYSAIATLLFQNPEESVKSLFHSPINSFRPLTLFIFAVEYYFLTLWTYGLAVPSGIFIPSLLTGAAWGRLFGVGVQYFFPHLENIDPGKYALAGAAAQLGGIVRMTISLTAIIVEATKDITFGLPIMLVLMIAKWVGDIFNEGLYDSHISLAEIPILGWHAPKLSRNILGKNVMRKDVVALEPVECVGRIVEILRSTNHHGFPVVDRIDTPPTDLQYPDYGHLKGLILRSQLIVLLKKKHFTLDYEGRHPASGSQPVSMIPIAELGLSREDEQCWVNFKPFLHISPHRVPCNASLDSIFRLFRGLGLRFLLVVNDENKLRGIITRKDIARFKERRVKKKYLVHEVYISHFNN